MKHSKTNRGDLAEIDRTLKKIYEGKAEFEVIFQKIRAAPSSNQKEKHETDLKREIKKLQRLREQVKYWIGLNEVKNKTPLIDARKQIENDMEKYKNYERESKTKEYSNKGLKLQLQQKRAAQEARDRDGEGMGKTTKWMERIVLNLENQIKDLEAQIDELESKHGSDHTEDAYAIAALDERLDRHRAHVRNLKMLIRRWKRKKLSQSQLEPIRQPLEEYLSVKGIVKGDLSETLPSVLYQYFNLPEEEDEEEELSPEEEEDDDFEDYYDDDDFDDSSQSQSGLSVESEIQKEPEKEPNPKEKIKEEEVIIISPKNRLPPNSKKNPSSLTNSPLSTSSSTIERSPSPKREPTTTLQNNTKNSSSSSPSTISEPQHIQQVPLNTSTLIPKQINTKQSNTQQPKNQPQSTSSKTITQPQNTNTKQQANSTVQQHNAAPQNSNQQPQSQQNQTTPAVQIQSAQNQRRQPNTNQKTQPQPQNAATPSTQTTNTPATTTQVTPAPQNQKQIPPAKTVEQPKTQTAASKTITNSANNTNQTKTQAAQQGAKRAAASTTQSQQSQTQTTQNQQTQQSSQTPSATNSNTTTTPSNEIPSLSTLAKRAQTNQSTRSQVTVLQPPHQTDPNTSVTESPKTPESSRSSHRELAISSEQPKEPPHHQHHLEILNPALHPLTIDPNEALITSMKYLPESYDSERPRQYQPKNPYHTSSYFPSQPSPYFDDPTIFEKFESDTLFFIFYYQQGTYQQYLGAKELKRQSWRYHKKYLTWFQRHEEPKEITLQYEQGTYVYFDYETGWCQRKKTEFTFEYKFLEDKDLV